MRRISFLLFALTLLASVNSCDSGSDVVYLPFQSEEDGRWGLISQDGDVLFEDEFENRPSTPSNGRFFVKEGDGYCIYTLEEKPKQVGDKYKDIFPFNEGVTVAVKENQRICIIDRDGTVVKELGKINGKEILSCGEFREGLSVFRTEEGFGCVDTKGNVVIQPKWDYLSAFSEGVIIGGTDKHVLAFIDKKGNILSKYDKNIDIKLDFPMFKYGRIPYRGKHNKYFFVDENGNELTKVPSKVKKIEDWTKDNFIYASESDGYHYKYGLMNMDGQVLIRPKYEALYYASDNLLYAYDGRDGEYFLINLDGDKMGEEEFKHVFQRYDHKFIGFVSPADGEWMLIDQDGKDLKIKTEIHNIKNDYWRCPEHLIESDYFDVEGLVSNLGITDKSIMGLGFDKTTVDCIKYFNTLNCIDENPDASDYTYRWSLSWTKKDRDYEVKLSASFNESLASSSSKFDENSWSYEYSYKWNEQSPQSILVEISGDDFERRLGAIFDALLIKLDVIGKISKKEDNLAVAKIGTGFYVVTRNKSSISMKFTKDVPQSLQSDDNEDECVEEVEDSAYIDY